MAGTTLAHERAQVAAAARRLAAERLVLATSGNVSCRASTPEGDRIAVTPTGAVLADLQPPDVTVVGPDGGVVAGELAPTSELLLHLELYRRYDVAAVVHTHAPLATALACVLDELPCIHYQMLDLGGAVRVAPYRTFGTVELATAVADGLVGRSAVLMSNHGAVTTGPDLQTAVERALLLEWLCELWWRASALGEPRVLDAAAQQAVTDAMRARGYGSVQRLEVG